MSLLQSKADPSKCAKCGGDLDFMYGEVSLGVSELIEICCTHCHTSDEDYELEAENMPEEM